MSPTINNHALVIATGLIYLFKTPSVNDIVAIKYGDKILIKRIKKIKKNKYNVEGDNRKDSLDSNHFGFVSKDKILGKVIYVFK